MPKHKKNKIIAHFFIFLLIISLSSSVVYAGFFDWVTGNQVLDTPPYSPWGLKLGITENEIPTGQFKAYYFNTNNIDAVLKTEIVDRPSIRYIWSDFLGIASGDFGAYWVGNFDFKETTKMVFEVGQQNSVTRIYVDGVLIADHSQGKITTHIFSSGRHRVEVEHENNWHTTEVMVRFAKPSQIYSSSTLKNAISNYLTPQTEAWFAGVYESKDRYGIITLDLAPSSEPVILVLDSYEAVVWNINGASQANLKAVVLSSRLPGADVENLPSNIPVFRTEAGLFTSKPWGPSLSDLQSRTITNLGAQLSGYTSTYGATTLKIPLNKVAVVKEDLCTDSDDGKDYYTKGTVSGIKNGNSYEYFDGCHNSSSIIEWYCDGNEPKADFTADFIPSCPNGCKAGACLKEEPITLIKEQVKCVFANSEVKQKCYTDDGNFVCSGVGACVADVSGEKGKKLTWKSSCGGYAYTTIDGINEYAKFDCSAEVEAKCTDTDGGINYYARGVVKAEGDINLREDQCSNDWVIEQFCEIDINQLPSTYHCDLNGACYTKLECPNGCKDGACIKEPESTCKDSDGGKNYYSKGYVIGEGIKYEDKCALGQEGNPDTVNDPNLLFEAYCFEEKFGYGYDYYSCPNGCKDGACISTLPPPPTSTWVGNPLSCRIYVERTTNVQDLSLKLITDEVTRGYSTIHLWYDNNGKKGSEIFSSSDIELIDSETLPSEWGNWGYRTNYRGIKLFYGYHKVDADIEIKPGYYWAGVTQSQGGLSVLNTGVFNDGNPETYSTGNDGRTIEPKWDCYYKFNIDDQKEEASCQDSDGGKNYYVKGKASGVYKSGVYDETEDSCIDNPKSSIQGSVVELYCEDGMLRTTTYGCPNGCKDGACLKEKPITLIKEQVKCIFANSEVKQKCYTDDGNFVCSGVGACVADVSGEKGKKLTWKSSCGGYAYTTIDGINEYAEFSCEDKRKCQDLSEKECNEVGNCEAKYGPSQCSPDGICTADMVFQKCIPKGYGAVCGNNFCEEGEADTPGGCGPDADPGCLGPPSRIGTCPQDCKDIRPRIDKACNGCLRDDTCLPFGIRLIENEKTMYCDITKNLAEQKEEEKSCQNNYECSTNICVNNQCISPGLIQKIINWFARLFG